ncbi:MAG: UDP-N-acetylmuramoyl-L-alanine--D-glutamate ligase [Clostridiales bacterium]|nr:UDP-N-acetylmuramoyl-L-alanine--D-glutamate ligase [Clostridiales bacterium]
MSQKLIEYLENKKILILGFGREGRSSYEYIRRFLPEKPLAIADKNPQTLEDSRVCVICGDGYLDCLGDFDIVLKSPGIPFRGVNIPQNTEITCQTDLFLRFCECTTVGITGTKGKTTTSTLIYSILREAGLNAELIGNMGIPVFGKLDMPRDSVAVIEMSSHQLEFTHASPHVSVLTNIWQEHLDHYNGGFEGYVNAKLNIARFQHENDFFIYDDESGSTDAFDPCELTAAKRIAASHSDIAQDAFISGLAGINSHLMGEHNAQDIYFAVCAARCLGVDDEAAKRAIAGFAGIEHRMEKVGTYKGITFYNDCIATVPEAVRFAVDALKNTGTLIMGGKDRGISYDGFCDYLSEKKLPCVIGLPDTGHKICSALTESGYDGMLIKAKDMDDAVMQAYAHTHGGMCCVLSPAASSYNVYRNFEEKGRHYKSLVKKYGEAEE